MKSLVKFLEQNRMNNKIKDIVQTCISFYLIQEHAHSGLKGEMCYVGVTNDVKVRDSQHRANSFWKHNCESSDLALAVEKALANIGFDAGSEQGHGNKDSIWVYAYIKTKDTRENTAGPIYKDPNKPYYTGE